MARYQKYGYRSRRRSDRRGRQSEAGLFDLTVAVVGMCARLLMKAVNFLRGKRAIARSAAAPHYGSARPRRRQEDRRARHARINATLRMWAAHPIATPGTAPAARETPEVLPYRRAPHLLTRGERAFWYPLFQAVKGKYRVFCKVRLADVVSAPDDPDEWRWFRKIRGYHVDFVICEPRSTAPLLVVELDDCLHRSERRRDRDRFKDAALAAAGVPVYRVRALAAYDPQELAETIERMINGRQH